ncbi:AtpZ/AtpI family protein [Parasphingopyxis marina]|uniref:ATP synthase protein I n=1 Tax=Parasphingopyxis marina TaxID=2761622 RepID=A0A842I0K4_9SPHN|nr:AtpZ/AtpI family protein [Parasphingopyxis marina]MBC2778221.1 AtpZ/AtpI family protein [Parasphingopyxis marina]
MAENEPGRDSFVAEDSRLQSLEKRLQAAQRAEEVRSGRNEQSSGNGMNVASRAVSELIGGPVGGAVVGWLFDWLFGTYPWFLMGMMFLGFVVAVVNVYRMTSKPPQ